MYLELKKYIVNFSAKSPERTPVSRAVDETTETQPNRQPEL